MLFPESEAGIWGELYNQVSGLFGIILPGHLLPHSKNDTKYCISITLASEIQKPARSILILNFIMQTHAISSLGEECLLLPQVEALPTLYLLRILMFKSHNHLGLCKIECGMFLAHASSFMGKKGTGQD